ncbi:hypothetical protein L6Q96_17410 [Candidatus Binatia bacterium]|nr:hypothetical protein [Candidatus Binatia bacterium]
MFTRSLQTFAAVRSCALLIAVCLPVSALAQAPSLRIEPAAIVLSPGQSAIVQVNAANIPAPGLAAFQFDVGFNPAVVAVGNPNEAYRGAGVPPFAPLGGDPICTTVRGTSPCPDPPWMPTSTGRTALGTDVVDTAGGRVHVLYATYGIAAPPAGAGTVALLRVTATTTAPTFLTLSNVILAGDQEPPLPFAVAAYGAAVNGGFSPTPTIASTASPTPTSTPPVGPTTPIVPTPTFTVGPPTATATGSRTPTRTATGGAGITATPTPTPTGGHGISGRLRYYNGSHNVNGATVELQGTPPAAQMSDSAGQYAFGNLAAATWQVAPRKDGNFGSGISALDASYVLQSVVGLRVLNANQRLAADVTGNGSISALDASRILQKVVGIIARMPLATTCNSDWLFVPAPVAVANQQVVQPVISSGVCQPGAIAYAPLAGAAAGQDFLGILIGDVTGNWAPNAGAAAALVSGESAPAVRLGRTRSGRRGARQRIPVYVAAGDALTAVDFRVEFDPERLRLARVRRGPQAEGGVLAYHGDTPGVVRIAMASATALPPNGGILVIEFEGDPAAPVRIGAAAAGP